MLDKKKIEKPIKDQICKQICSVNKLDLNKYILHIKRFKTDSLWRDINSHKYNPYCTASQTTIFDNLSYNFQGVPARGR